MTAGRPGSIHQRLVGAACPWCQQAPGYRHLDSREELRRAPLVFLQSALSGFANAHRPIVFVHAMMTSTQDLRCLGCARLVRVCPHCDLVTRYVNSSMKVCQRCDMAFM